MPNKMLIDASHPEETRVVVVRGNRIEEFDFESQSKKQLKGNIYLARVTRVEPSLQAAFVEYGGNRHGFLAFSEVHPDYYQIPVADRQALLAAEAEQDAEDEESDADKPENGRRKRKRGGRGRGRAITATEEPLAESSDDDLPETTEETDSPKGPAMAAAAHADVISESVDERIESEEQNLLAEPQEESQDDNKIKKAGKRRARRREEAQPEDGEDGDVGLDDSVEMVGAEDALDELPSRRRPIKRNYKIQEVIKRRQILLVQVVKEERGNKGAALTTYLSLAGRYAVLMPNTARGGGISRKITNAQDRKRLKEVVKELDVPKGMGVILRTAGANRTKAEVKRDYEYLMRLWMRVRSLTLESTAPALVHEEGSLIKRSVRDLYNKDIDEILVAGEEGYREAKDFMRMLMPSHAKVVQPYRDRLPIFARNGIEAQLDRMLQPQVTLKSGGYIIINQTEALVAIDVNSGRSTREHSIENTALQTNLEAADEVARQLRLRDLAGLIVIDFIDMEEKRNNRAVEKKLKECLKNDRARIQVGRISHFGLLEMSRQRIRASVLESTMQVCEYCNGTGYIRSESSVALHVVRGIEEYLLKNSSHDIIVKTSAATALYVLNYKRTNLSELEERFGLSITIEADETLGGQHFVVSKGERAIDRQPSTPLEADESQTIDEKVEAQDEEDQVSDKQQDDESEGKKKRRRRRRRGGQNREADAKSGENETQPESGSQGGEETDVEEMDQQPKKRRRGRRGGRRSRGSGEAGDLTAADSEKDETPAEGREDEVYRPEPSDKAESVPGDAESRERQDDSAEQDNRPEKARKPARRPGRKKSDEAVKEDTMPEPVVVSTISGDQTDQGDKPQKQGWWKRKGFL